MLKNTRSHWDIEAVLRYIYLNEIIFISLIVLCFIGEILTEVSERVGLFYWMLMLPIFFVSSLISEQAKNLKNGHKTKCALQYLFIYWGTASIAALLVMLIWHSNTITPESGAIFIHIILAQTLFLSGVVLGRRFYLIGTLLFLTAAQTIFSEAGLGIALILIVTFLCIGLHIEKRYLFPFLKKRHDLNYKES